MGFGLRLFYRRVLGQWLLVRLRIVVRLWRRLFGFWRAVCPQRADSGNGQVAVLRHGDTPGGLVGETSKIGQARMRHKRRMEDQGAPPHTGKYLFPDNLQIRSAAPLSPPSSDYESLAMLAPKRPVSVFDHRPVAVQVVQQQNSGAVDQHVLVVDMPAQELQYRLSSTTRPAMSHTPLNDDEYAALDALQDVAWLEGFLTAIVITPIAPAQAVWLPAALQDPQAEALTLRHHHYMQTWMAKDPASFEPIYECGGNWTATQWAAGFRAAMALDRAAWDSLRSAHPEWLAAFAEDVAEDTAYDAIPSAVISIHAHWHPPKGAKVGRNDPCPCGSGKKYKKCCGA